MTMRVGIVLPTFAATADAALSAAADAEARGIHGVFAYDHLWPMGHPGRPALSPSPVLAAVAMRTTRVAVGILVARVGLRPDDVLLDELASLQALSLGRLVAGIGTGDAKSAEENLAYGVGFPPARERRDRLAGVVCGECRPRPSRPLPRTARSAGVACSRASPVMLPASSVASLVPARRGLWSGGPARSRLSSRQRRTRAWHLASLGRWSFAASTACRPTSLPRSTP
jgi:hypothetical protein